MKCFVIMPFDTPFDPVFEAVRRVAHDAVTDTPFECYWLKDLHAAGRITDDILAGLADAAFCIADVTGHNPNVMWETGYAMALGKPTILIGQDIEGLPFDLRSHRVLPYTLGALDELRVLLEKSIRDTLSRYQLKGSGRTELPAAQKRQQKTIVVTGTMRANEAAVVRRLESMLSPYLSKTTEWLTGSVGTVDVAAVNFLLEHEQQVTTVGYHRFDCAPDLRGLIERGTLGFLDASIEALPKRMPGPSARDVLFCMRGDLIILFWDGQSEGTKDLVQYYQEQGVSSLLAFV